MPAKPKPSEIASEAKRKYFPWLEKNFPNLSAQASVHAQPAPVTEAFRKGHGPKKLRIAVMEGDPVDIALDWNESQNSGQASMSKPSANGKRVLLVVPVDEARPGGDWESGAVALEENLARRSSLVVCLKRTAANAATYPIPVRGGLYTPKVAVFRSGPANNYATIWNPPKESPVIAVAPVRRPKLNASGKDYTFEAEKELMKEKMRVVLRIAAAWQHESLCIGPFGVGSSFRNPVPHLAAMWRDILFGEPEFKDAFANICFAFDSAPVAGKSAAAHSDFDIFKKEFDPSNVCKTSYR